MKKLSYIFTFIILVLFVFIFSGCQKKGLDPISENQITPLIGNVLVEPEPVPLSDGKYYIMYELMITNVTKSDITIENLTLTDPLNNNVKVTEMDSEKIKTHLHIALNEEPNNVIKPNETAAIMINEIFDEANIPKAIDHNISYKTADPYSIIPAEGIEKIARTSVSDKKPIVISPPLTGNNWLALNVSNNYGHRNAFFSMDGQWFVPERWAVDYIKLTNNNQIYSGDPQNFSSYPCYDQDLLAVKEGKVLKVVDGLDNLAIGATLQNMTLDNLGGNYVLIDIGDGYSAFYAHIIKNTITVKEGDMVKTGQVIGKLGNSGNSTSPHLHFHIVKGSFPIAAQGVPYVINKFNVDGEISSLEDAEKSFVDNSPFEFTKNFAGEHTNQMPADATLVSF